LANGGSGRAPAPARRGTASASITSSGRPPRTASPPWTATRPASGTSRAAARWSSTAREPSLQPRRPVRLWHDRGAEAVEDGPLGPTLPTTVRRGSARRCRARCAACAGSSRGGPALRATPPSRWCAPPSNT
jgi:hypothetical protein